MTTSLSVLMEHVVAFCQQENLPNITMRVSLGNEGTTVGEVIIELDGPSNE